MNHCVFCDASVQGETSLALHLLAKHPEVFRVINDPLGPHLRCGVCQARFVLGHAHQPENVLRDHLQCWGGLAAHALEEGLHLQGTR